MDVGAVPVGQVILKLKFGSFGCKLVILSCALVARALRVCVPVVSFAQHRSKRRRMKMRGVLFTLGSFAITGAVVGNAWLQKKQFFPTVVYLTKSSPCMAVSV